MCFFKESFHRRVFHVSMGGGGVSDGGGFIFKWGGLPHGGASVLGGGRGFKKNHKMGGSMPHYGKPCSVPVSFFYPFCFPVILFSYFFLFHSLNCFPYFCYYFLICFSLFYFFLKFVVNFSLYFFFFHILSCLYFQKFSIIFLHTLNISSSISSFWPWLFNT